MKKSVVHIINSKKENAILILGDGWHEWKRYPKENFIKNPELIDIFYDDIKELEENCIVIFD